MSDAVIIAIGVGIINVIGLIVVTIINKLDFKKVKTGVAAVEIVAAKAVEKVEVIETKVDNVKTQQDKMHEDVNGKMQETIQLTKELGEAIGLQKGIEKEKADQKEIKKESDANLLASTLGEPNEVPPIPVEIKQPEGNPAPVTVVEKKDKDSDKKP